MKLTSTSIMPAHSDLRNRKEGNDIDGRNGKAGPDRDRRGAGHPAIGPSACPQPVCNGQRRVSDGRHTPDDRGRSAHHAAGRGRIDLSVRGGRADWRACICHSGAALARPPHPVPQPDGLHGRDGSQPACARLLVHPDRAFRDGPGLCLLLGGRGGNGRAALAARSARQGACHRRKRLDRRDGHRRTRRHIHQRCGRLARRLLGGGGGNGDIRGGRPGSAAGKDARLPPCRTWAWNCVP